MDHKKFISGSKTKIIAPAGFGKTTAIVDCLEYTEGRQLILTHTHAGIASIKSKLKKKKIVTSRIVIETICGFAGRYVHAFYKGKDIPEQSDENYYEFVNTHAVEILEKPCARYVISNSYTRLFVDEYQDCTKKQHLMIQALASVLPTHIFADPLQGIFDFNNDDPLVDFASDLSEFEEFPPLSVPWRWNNAERVDLGERLASMRSLLENGSPVDLANYESSEIEVRMVKSEMTDRKYKYPLRLAVYENEESCLILQPPCAGDKPVKARKEIKSSFDFNNRFSLLEAIDDNSFYSLARQCDTMISSQDNKFELLFSFMKDLFRASDVDNWMSNKGVRKKKNDEDNAKSEKLKSLARSFEENTNAISILYILDEVYRGLKWKCYRHNLLYTIYRSLRNSHNNRSSVLEELVAQKNRIRKSGQRVAGRCIGSTLLTKGLEFDTVIILDAHKFRCPKNFYVAVTRCRKRLIICTKEKILNFQTKEKKPGRSKKASSSTRQLSLPGFV